jgi:translocation and assembly module TamA|tara:strand:- start:71515 stop:73302 length:1788 start_codon:yes stop_codon:yes gene_type:complete
MILKNCYFLKISALLVGVLALSGCFKSVLPFSQNTDYKIVGLEADKAVQSYAQKIITERLAESIAYEEGTQDFERAETVREETIAADLLKALKARGYYGAKVVYHDDEAESLKGVYDVKAGDMYTVSSLSITPENARQHFDFTIIDEGEPLKALPVLNAQNKLYEAAQKDQCYFSLNVEHSVILDEVNKTGALSYAVEMGPSATFGAVTFEGQRSVKDSYLREFISWKEGECFRQEKISALRTKLLETGLFVRADAALPAAPNETGVVPVTIQLKERVHRSVKAGVSYYTDEGAGVTLGWEHRNIFGGGEKLETALNINQINQSVDANFIKPFFLRKDQSLEMNSALRQQDTDAYEETAFDLGAGLKRQLNKRLSASTGIQLTFSEITDEDDTQTYGLLSFPNSILFDNRDNPLDPHRGWQLKAGIEPFYDVLGESDPFAKFEAGARTYIDFGTTSDLVLALRANLGSIVGASSDNIPATERFYAGGGGSVRGFGYQEVGPVDGGDPTGGRSAVTGATELRLKFTQTLGGVAFIDGGSVSESAAPDFDNLSFGAGLGFRYYTDFGPLRFDVAVPLNEKENLDQNYQFYISIGQAF